MNTRRSFTKTLGTGTALVLFLVLVLNVSFAQTKIEGLSYLDKKPVSVEIKDGKIVSVQQIDKLSDENHPVYIAPGLIDNQVNGFAGVSFCLAKGELSKGEILRVTNELWKKGVTTYFPTLTTNSQEALLKNFAILAKSKNDEALLGSIAGYHLEGPYISPVQGYRGAHLEKYIRLPDWDEFSELQKAARNRISLITVAPEVDGAIPFIQKCSKAGVLVALGHHNGSSEKIRDAVDAGASMATHLGNGCANMINRHNNPLWPQLADDRITASIIADGFHLNKDQLQCFYKMKGLERTILVSDALDLAGLPPGEYTRLERLVVLTEVVKFPAENVLAGAASPISTCVSNMIKFTGCSLENAIQMATANPARLFGLIAYPFRSSKKL